jgi:cytochrome c2
MPAVLTIARRAPLVVAGALAACGLAACGGGQVLPGAHADRGQQLIVQYGCGACHTIGGIDTANGTVGPRLTDFSSDRYIAGNLPNTPRNAARWIEDPHRYEPKTIMPDLGVTPAQAADIVAYLEGQ